MDWAPTLADREGPVYRHIVDALAADIANGRLRRGQQLPTHRALAKALSIDLTTVTRAYTEARRRGLTEARVGLGTFVCETLSHVRHAAPAQPAFDLSMNLPPQPMEADLEGRFMRGMAAIQREVGFLPISTTVSREEAMPNARSPQSGCDPVLSMRVATDS